MTTYTKDPAAVLDYTVDWSAWLQPGDTITTATWTVPAELTATRTSNDATTATVWLSGGTAFRTYPVTCRITTTAGRVDERSFTISCRNR